MERETQKVLVISTVHIGPQDTTWLEDNEVTIAQDEYGFFIWAKTEHRGLPSSIAQVLKTARNEGYDYVRLDRDGPVYDDLVKFDW